MRIFRSNNKSGCSRKRSRSAQAAMEFLMTYGWAILVVLAAIAALAYFGVLSPAKFLPEKCLFDPGLFCAGHKVQPTQIELVIENNVEGRTLMINDVTVGSCTGTFNTKLSGGDRSTFTVTGCSNGDVKDRYKAEMKVGYTDKDTNLTKTIYGQLNSKVE